jgi:RimJ/RimL family protein N-acetyltransferase
MPRQVPNSPAEHAIRSAEENRLAQIVCYIDPENVAALTLTQAAGFRSIGRDDFFITMRRMIR